MIRRPQLPDLLRWATAAVVLATAFALLPRLEEEARIATVTAAFDEAMRELEERLPAERPDLPTPLPASPYFEGIDAKAAEPALRARLRATPTLRILRTGRPLHVLVEADQRDGTTFVGVAYDPNSVRPVVVERDQRPIRPSAILPPLLAIVLAFATRRLVLSLGVAIATGAILAAGWNPFAFVPHAAVEYGWKATFSDPFKLWIFVFTCALVGLVSLATAAGGVQGVVRRLARVARGRRSTQGVTLLSGLAIFFDDYANTILVGTTMRPLTDRMRISREKLAWLVDSTSAPIAGLAVISTWIGYEVGLFGDLARGLNLETDGYGLFFAALPFRFYCMFTLVFLAVAVITGRDFGPMLRAERRAFETGALLRPGAMPLASATFRPVEAAEGVRQLARVAVIPVAAMIAFTLLGLLADGGGLARVAEAPLSLFHLATWRDAFGAAEHSTFVLAAASIAGSLILLAMVRAYRLLPLRTAAVAYGRGMATMWLAIVILTLAWAIKGVCDDLGTSHLLVAGLRDVVHPAALPLAIFGLAAMVAFATGTSWGTMGILLPTAGPLAWHLAGPEGMVLALAAVLDGAIFGDHTSPISDTTVMSSIASGSDLLDHVRTQAPYALVCMFVAAAFGYGWNALGYGYALGWLAGLAAIVGLLLLVGRRVGAAAPAAGSAAEAEAQAPGLDGA